MSERTLIYIDDYCDEWVPASTLDGWAKWLHANVEDDGPAEVIADGRAFAITVADARYHQIFWRDGMLDIPADFDWSHETIAMADQDGGGWSSQDIVVDAGEVRAAAGDMDEGDYVWVVTMNGRPGERTATYTFVDGEPVLQPDGWSL